MISLSQFDNNIILWKVENLECILNIPHANKNGILYSSCFIYDNSQSYIVTSNCNWDENTEFIKIFDFDGNTTKEINDSNEITFFIDNFFDNSINYIITGNYNYIKSYNYNSNELYHKYHDKDNNNDDNSHFIVITYKDDEKIKLIESCNDGNIRIWNFTQVNILIK